jgi:hypothetical protein
MSLNWLQGSLIAGRRFGPIACGVAWSTHSGIRTRLLTRSVGIFVGITGDRVAKSACETRRYDFSSIPALAPDVEPAAAERLAFPLPEKPSIAVLPLANLTGDPSRDFLVDGMTDSIITELSRDRALFVIARNSTFAYKGQPVKTSACVTCWRAAFRAIQTSCGSMHGS